MQTLRDITHKRNWKSKQRREGLGTFTGVFLPSFITITGAFLFLNLGAIIASGGVLMVVLLLFFALAITMIMALSVTSIASKTRIGQGGMYHMLSGALVRKSELPYPLASGVTMSFELRRPRFSLIAGTLTATLVRLFFCLTITLLLWNRVDKDIVISTPNIFTYLSLLGPIALIGLLGEFTIEDHYQSHLELIQIVSKAKRAVLIVRSDEMHEEIDIWYDSREKRSCKFATILAYSIIKTKTLRNAKITMKRIVKNEKEKRDKKSLFREMFR